MKEIILGLIKWFSLISSKVTRIHSHIARLLPEHDDCKNKYYHYTLTSFRVVADDQRSLALGLQSAIWRIFGAIPGPILFGLLFDAACLEWQDDCGRRGNCWVYNNDQLSWSALALAAPCLVISSSFFFLAWLTYPKQRESNGVKNMIFEVNGSTEIECENSAQESANDVHMQ